MKKTLRWRKASIITPLSASALGSSSHSVLLSALSLLPFFEQSLPSPLRLINGVPCASSVDARTLEKAAARARLPEVSSSSCSSSSSSENSLPSTAGSPAHAPSHRVSIVFFHALGSSLVGGLPPILRSYFGG